MRNIREFYPKIFVFLELKFSLYLNRRVFVKSHIWAIIITISSTTTTTSRSGSGGGSSSLNRSYCLTMFP